MGKKLFGTLGLGLLFTLIGAVLMATIGAFNSFVQGWIIDPWTTESSEGSSSETPEETPVFNIADHGTHLFEAIGDKIILTATVLPVDATDKTIVWTSDGPEYISVTAKTANSAEIECLQWFDDSISIYARATNGTSDTSDDFVASCVCTYYTAVNAIEIELWAVDEDLIMDHEITDLVDIPVDTDTYYRFIVKIFPQTASEKGFTASSEILYDGNFEADYVGGAMGGLDVWYEDGNGPDHALFVSDYFSMCRETIPSETAVISVISEDNATKNDTIEFTIGNHLTTGDLASTVAISADNVTYGTAISASSWETGVDTYAHYENVGSYIKITLPNETFVEGNYTVSVNSTYMTVVDDGSNVLGPGAIIIVHSILATGETPTIITIHFTSYPSCTLNVPFLAANPKVNVTGISLDNTTVTF